MKHQRISIDPAVMMGKPCIAGTRTSAEQIIREMSAGLSIADILDAHSMLSVEDIQASLAWAADVLRHAWLINQPGLIGEEHALSGGRGRRLAHRAIFARS
ncbi:MAG: DUF433 domain-containing protein [Anaerolineae bacterium]|nr:DUF433 domain-containing protein [Anaerolineae bacterium]